MQSLSFAADHAPRVLCLAAHCDDIEIGCAGTLMTLQERYPDARFDWVVFSGENGRDLETQRAATMIHGQGKDQGTGHSRAQVEVLQFQGSYFPYCREIKDLFERLKQRLEPTVIFTHFLHDRHQDHRVIAELTWNSFRNHLVLEYEIPKYEGDLAHPNFYVPLSSDIVTRKTDMLMDCFPSQHSRSWFHRDVFLAHLRLRGIECNAPSGHAEALHARKLVW